MTGTESTIPLQALIDRYSAAWSEPDGSKRRMLLEQIWADGATYTDPTVHLKGVDALVAHIGGILKTWPGAKVVRTTTVDVHHGMARFGWKLIRADGTALPEGLDIAWISPDGMRIERIVGFFGPLRTA